MKHAARAALAHRHPAAHALPHLEVEAHGVVGQREGLRIRGDEARLLAQALRQPLGELDGRGHAGRHLQHHLGAASCGGAG